MSYPPRWAAALLFAFAAPPAITAAEPTDHFETKVRPLLVQHCVKCHGQEKQKGALRLDSKAGWEAGGESGPAIKPGKPDESILIKAVRGADGAKQMPPDGKLAAAEVAALVQWVKDGAVDPRDGGPARLGGVTLAEAKKWWSFQPISRPAIPKLKSQPTNPIDAFVVAKLSDKGLSLSPPADRRTLVRRATYDLTGLPPTPVEVDAFVKDTAPDAYEKVIDRLLASPAYGERWGRHWLDLVRYADTAGENSDHPLPHAWRYRNWVIDAFNRDVPYDEFLRDQLAGDILAARGPAEKYAPRVVATGFLALARRFGHDIDKDVHLTHEDTIDTVGKAFLGLTIGCARCHDHKYDAISAKDYYALYGIFDSTRLAFPGCEPHQQPRDLVPLAPPAEWDRVVKYRARLAATDARLKHLRDEQAKLLRAVLRLDLHALATVAEQRAALDRERAALVAAAPAQDVAFAVTEGTPHNAKLHLRGDPEKPGPVVPRRWLEVFGAEPLPAKSGSGRLELAGWIASKGNPLTARVIANRVWLHHFGKALVATPNDFGTRGSPPTHPELLDWLACELQEPTPPAPLPEGKGEKESGAPPSANTREGSSSPFPSGRGAGGVGSSWSIKRLHRLIMLSATYRQSGAARTDAAALDANNDLYWRFDRRRLSAEELRDALLATSGRLDRAPGGPHPFPPEASWNYTQHVPFSTFYESDKRSVYLISIRNRRHPFLGLFDGADPNATTPQRQTTTVPTQALYFLNDPFFHAQAEKVAGNALPKTDDAARLNELYRLAFQRAPAAKERATATAFLARYTAALTDTPAADRPKAAWAALARVLLASNEFLYLD